MITTEQLKKIATTLLTDRAIIMSNLLNALCLKYSITTPTQFHEFLANVLQESAEFAYKTENMNYRAETLVKVWPSRFPTLAAATPYAHNPEKLANFVYGDRMGNTLPGDGWLYRGGGFIGLTGKEVYTKYAKYLGKSVEDTANWVHTTDEGALDSAFWFFYILKDLKDDAERDDIMGIIKSINGGFIGKEVRLKYYEKAKKLI